MKTRRRIMECGNIFYNHDIIVSCTRGLGGIGRNINKRLRSMCVVGLRHKGLLRDDKRINSYCELRSQRVRIALSKECC